MGGAEVERRLEGGGGEGNVEEQGVLVRRLARHGCYGNIRYRGTTVMIDTLKGYTLMKLQGINDGRSVDWVSIAEQHGYLGSSGYELVSCT